MMDFEDSVMNVGPGIWDIVEKSRPLDETHRQLVNQLSMQNSAQDFIQSEKGQVLGKPLW